MSGYGTELSFGQSFAFLTWVGSFSINHPRRNTADAHCLIACRMKVSAFVPHIVTCLIGRLKPLTCRLATAGASVNGKREYPHRCAGHKAGRPTLLFVASVFGHRLWFVKVAVVDHSAEAVRPEARDLIGIGVSTPLV